MVYRIYVEKKCGLDNEARALKNELSAFLGINGVERVRIINRYDAENITEELFDYAVKTVLSEPQLDNVSFELNGEGYTLFAVEYLPGQFDQRADSAAQCIQIISQGERPTVKTAKVYLLYGDVTDAELNEIKKYVINPVESREASLEEAETLKTIYDIPTEVSLNTIMVDGTGMCGACRVTVDGKTKFVCVDGPEFDGHKVDFDEAMRRQAMYKNQERLDNDNREHKCKCYGE